MSFLREKCTHVMGMLTERLINALNRTPRLLFCDATSRGLLKLLSHHVRLCLFNLCLHVQSTSFLTSLTK